MVQSTVNIFKDSSEANISLIKTGELVIFWIKEEDNSAWITFKDGITIPFPSNQTFNGTLERYYTAGENINFGQCVYLDGGLVKKLSSLDDSLNSKFIGVAKQSVLSGEQILVVQYGEMNGLTLVPGQWYYVGTDSSVTSTIPAVGFSQRIGYAIDSSRLFIDGGNSVILT